MPVQWVPPEAVPGVCTNAGSSVSCGRFPGFAKIQKENQMKKSMAVILLMLGALMVSVLAVPCQSAVTDDCNWPCIYESVKAKQITMDEGLDIASQFEDAVKLGQKLNAEGSYAEAVAATPLNWCKAWYQLHVMQEAMGGKKNPNGIWSGFNVTYEKRTDGGIQTVYAGDAKAVRDSAAKVREFIAKAKASTIPGPTDGPNALGKCEEMLIEYLSWLPAQ